MSLIIFGVGNVTRSKDSTVLQNVENTLSVGSVVNIRVPCLSQMPERRIMCLEAARNGSTPLQDLTQMTRTQLSASSFRCNALLMKSRMRRSILPDSRFTWHELSV
jgi:hypothetical protein